MKSYSATATAAIAIFLAITLGLVLTNTQRTNQVLRDLRDARAEQEQSFQRQLDALQIQHNIQDRHTECLVELIIESQQRNITEVDLEGCRIDSQALPGDQQSPIITTERPSNASQPTEGSNDTSQKQDQPNEPPPPPPPPSLIDQVLDTIQGLL